MSRDILLWDAVLADGTRIPITLKQSEMTSLYLGKTPEWEGMSSEKTPALAAHEVCSVLMNFGHDVRDLVPRGSPSRAELEAQLSAVSASLVQSEAVSEGRRKTLLQKSEELREEWQRAESTAAPLYRLRTAVDGFIGALGLIRCDQPKCDEFAMRSKKVDGYNLSWCDAHAHEGAVDLARSPALRALIAALAKCP